MELCFFDFIWMMRSTRVLEILLFVLVHHAFWQMVRQRRDWAERHLGIPNLHTAMSNTSLARVLSRARVLKKLIQRKATALDTLAMHFLRVLLSGTYCECKVEGQVHACLWGNGESRM